MDTAPDLSTAAGAEVAFYRALAHGDHALMEAVWAPDDAVGCVHPGWPALRGRQAVLASFKRMFDAGQRLDLRCEVLLARALGADLALHLTHEFITTPGGPRGAPPMVATNLYRLSLGQWRIVWHHASPTPPLDPDAAVVH